MEANPQKKLAMVKPAAEIANSNRVPNARDRKPDSGMAITSAIRYEVWTHDTSVELAERPAWISAGEAETIWMSRIDMNIPNTMIRNANSRRAGRRARPARLRLVIIDGDAVVASAMICPGRRGTEYDPALKSSSRRSRSASLSASAAPSRGVDGGVDRHAGAQQVLFRNVLRHTDPHRQALHDLGEIAGGVVRRQQREHRTRAGEKLSTMPAKLRWP